MSRALESLGRGSCKTCKFFERVAEAKDLGVCHLHPPTAAILMVPQQNPFSGERSIAPQPFCTFPQVNDDTWCGQYTSKVVLGTLQ